MKIHEVPFLLGRVPWLTTCRSVRTSERYPEAWKVLKPWPQSSSTTWTTGIVGKDTDKPEQWLMSKMPSQTDITGMSTVKPWQNPPQNQYAITPPVLPFTLFYCRKRSSKPHQQQHEKGIILFVILILIHVFKYWNPKLQYLFGGVLGTGTYVPFLVLDQTNTGTHSCILLAILLHLFCKI